MAQSWAGEKTSMLGTVGFIRWRPYQAERSRTRRRKNCPLTRKVRKAIQLPLVIAPARRNRAAPHWCSGVIPSICLRIAPGWPCSKRCRTICRIGRMASRCMLQRPGHVDRPAASRDPHSCRFLKTLMVERSLLKNHGGADTPPRSAESLLGATRASDRVD